MFSPETWKIYQNKCSIKQLWTTTDNMIGSTRELGSQEIVESALINIGLVKPSPREWPKVGLGTAKEQLKKGKDSVQRRIKNPWKHLRWKAVK